MKLNFKLACTILFLFISVVVLSCKEDDKNNDPVPASCTDGIQNQTETGVDCGGPCTACAVVVNMTAKVDNVNWTAGLPISVQNSPATKITIIGISPSAGTRITINYTGPFALGTVNMGPTFSSEYRDSGGTPYGGINGSITFTKFNTVSRTISGTFLCQVKDNNANVTKTITTGVFSNLTY